jgi:hypothetical protein
LLVTGDLTQRPLGTQLDGDRRQQRGSVWADTGFLPAK